MLKSNSKSMGGKPCFCAIGLLSAKTLLASHRKDKFMTSTEKINFVQLGTQ